MTAIAARGTDDSTMDMAKRFTALDTLEVVPWVETCGNCGQRFAITGGAGPRSKFEDIRCPSCHAFWGRSPSDDGFHTTALGDDAVKRRP